MFDNLYDYLYEKGTNPKTRDNICYNIISSLNDRIDGITGECSYANLLRLVNAYVEKYKNIELNTKLYIDKKVYIDDIAKFIALLKLKKTPILLTSDLNPEIEYVIENGEGKDFFVLSSGTTGLFKNPLPICEKELADIIYDDYNNKYTIHSEIFYSTISMSGIAGVSFNAFLPIITDNKVYINDNDNFFENIHKTKSTMFILPRNYKKYLKQYDKNEYDFSFVKYVILTGGFFSKLDIDELCNFLPGLSPDAFVNVYSCTELGGRSSVCFYKDFHPIYLSIQDLLNNKVKIEDKNDNYSIGKYLNNYRKNNCSQYNFELLDDKFEDKKMRQYVRLFYQQYSAIRYISCGNTKVSNISIINEKGEVQNEKTVGIVCFDNVVTNDIGIIINDNLYVLGRKENDEHMNLSILRNYLYNLTGIENFVLYYDGKYYVFADSQSYLKNKSKKEYLDYLFFARQELNGELFYLYNHYNLPINESCIFCDIKRNGRLEKGLIDETKINFNDPKCRDIIMTSFSLLNSIIYLIYTKIVKVLYYYFSYLDGRDFYVDNFIDVILMLQNALDDINSLDSTEKEILYKLFAIYYQFPLTIEDIITLKNSDDKKYLKNLSKDSKIEFKREIFVSEGIGVIDILKLLASIEDKYGDDIIDVVEYYKDDDYTKHFNESFKVFIKNHS